MKSTLHLFVFTLLAFPWMAVAEMSPTDVWKDFDPDKGEFNEEIIREVTRDGVYQRESYISAWVLDEEIRVYCKYSVKEGAKMAPGLMDVHGWMGAPNADKKYVEDGWAVLAHDYCGDNGARPHYTKYPESLRYGNMDGKTGYRVKSTLQSGSFITDPRQTDDYLWYALQRRALSYLLAQKEVDPNRIGAKGYSYGGTIMWNLGMDPRVKAVVAYFGIGWLEYYRTRGVWMYDPAKKAPEPTEGEKLYLSAIAPQAHAPHITAASLWLNGTNDHHGGHERGEETFKHFKEGVPWAFAHQPRGHHDTQTIGQNTKFWLDKYVLGKEVAWPGQATSKIVLDAEGIPEFHVTPADQDEIAEVKAYYALKNPVSYGRAWRDVTLEKKGDSWIGKMPVMKVDDYVFGFSNITYQSSIVLSSPFQAVIPGKLGNAKATDKPSTTLSEGTGAWVNVGPVQGKNDIKGFRVLSARGAFNEQFSDPKLKAPQGAQLFFKFYCTQPQKILMMVNKHNKGEIEIPASNDWQEMVVSADRFVNQHSKQAMPSWEETKSITLKPAPGEDITKVVFADFKWVVSKDAKPVTPAKTGASGMNQEMPAGLRVHLEKQFASEVDSFVKVSNNKAWQETPITIGGKEYQRGLGVHADSKLVFPLNEEFATFHVTPGPDDSHSGVLEMLIQVDEKVVFSSGPIHSKDGKIRKSLTIPVKGAKALTLEVKASNGNNGGDHASWADAYLERPANGAFYTPDADKNALKKVTPDVDASLPFVLILGDSISIGYMPTVIAELEGKANVSRPKANCGDTNRYIASLDRWLGKKKWDIIHFNAGLHDLCYRHPDAKVYGNRDKVNGTVGVTLDQYETNLEAIVLKLKATGATLVWASTTVVPDGEAGRHAGDEIKYNKVAKKVMEKHEIAINDLHAATSAFPPELSSKPSDVHFTKTGSQKLGEQVAAAILKQVRK